MAVIVCSLSAAGVGINLQVASNLVLAELSWTDAEQTQAIDRVHRIGQDEPVTAWRIIAAQTIDTKVAELIDSKAGLAARALDAQDIEASSVDVQVEALVALLTDALRGRATYAVRLLTRRWRGEPSAPVTEPTPRATVSRRLLSGSVLDSTGRRERRSFLDAALRAPPQLSQTPERGMAMKHVGQISRGGRRAWSVSSPRASASPRRLAAVRGAGAIFGGSTLPPSAGSPTASK